ncbi:hypothetical protein [Desulfitobacterium sp.]|uniref:hypothetical protein n=1 Tax=Desulfitobacterium sp. TaxID=49981 RepID=UPI002B201E45|nr:hypothetical protein [Desulfitobacterium sp.]MEA4900857.1 hypothetical protein [Desulfitobacterium sp.]
MDKETLRIWAWRLALGTALVVGILSWVTKVGFLRIMIRIILSYLLIYGLSYGSLYWFEKAAPPGDDVPPDNRVEDELNGTRGALFDVAVGEDEMDPPIAGQVNADLSEGLPDAEQQADMVRRMGWGE